MVLVVTQFSIKRQLIVSVPDADYVDIEKVVKFISKTKIHR